MIKDYQRKERKQRRIEDNKRFILKAAEKVFARKGFSLTTVDEIADEAQFSKATIYKYFKSKNDLFYEIIFKSFDETCQKMAKIQQKKMSAEEKLKELIRYTSSYYQKKKNMTRIFFMEKAAMKKIFNLKEHAISQTEHPQIPYEFKEKIEKISRIINEVIDEGITNGEFRKVDVKDAAYIFGAMLRGCYFKGPVARKEYSINETTELLHNFFLYGIKKRGKH